MQQVTGGTVTLPADVLNGLGNAKAEKRKKQKVNSTSISSKNESSKNFRKRQEDRPQKIIIGDVQMIAIVPDMMTDVIETIDMNLDIMIHMFLKGALMFETIRNKLKSRKLNLSFL